MTRMIAGRGKGTKMLKPTDEIPGWTDERAPDDVIKGPRWERKVFQAIGSACCECWQAFDAGQTIRVYTFPSGTRLWFHHGNCWRAWWHRHGEVIGLAVQLDATRHAEFAASDDVVQAAIPSHLLD